jgi:hypothetical protein
MRTRKYRPAVLGLRNCRGSVYPRERYHSRFFCGRLYFLGNRASSARSVGIGVQRTCSNSNAEVSVLLRRTNCVPMISKLWPFKSARFSGPMSSHIKSSLSHVKSFMPTPAGACACCRTVRSFRDSVTREPKAGGSIILNEKSCVWRIADSGEISNSPHTQGLWHDRRRRRAGK